MGSPLDDGLARTDRRRNPGDDTHGRATRGCGRATRRSRRARRITLALAFAATTLGAPALAGPADVVSARVQCSAHGGCTFDVTVIHADTGWQHFADRWEVVGPGGETLATRVLRHPHVEEQPFTRRLAGVRIPTSVTEVVIRARDSRHGFGGAELTVEIPR